MTTLKLKRSAIKNLLSTNIFFHFNQLIHLMHTLAALTHGFCWPVPNFAGFRLSGQQKGLLNAEFTTLNKFSIGK